MFLFSQLTSQLISLAAIGVYLAAAFLPCEPTAEERSAIAWALSGVTMHTAVHTAVSPPKSPNGASLPGDAVDDHAHHSPVGHGAAFSAHDDLTPIPAPTHDHSAHAHSAEGKQVHLALKAKCVCGCDRTRSQVGGGAARLGSVVLAAFVTGLAPAPVVVPEDRVLARWVEVHFEDDLVPI